MNGGEIIERNFQPKKYSLFCTHHLQSSSKQMTPTQWFFLKKKTTEFQLNLPFSNDLMNTIAVKQSIILDAEREKLSLIRSIPESIWELWRRELESMMFVDANHSIGSHTWVEQQQWLLFVYPLINKFQWRHISISKEGGCSMFVEVFFLLSKVKKTYSSALKKIYLFYKWL